LFEYDLEDLDYPYPLKRNCCRALDELSRDWLKPTRASDIQEMSSGARRTKKTKEPLISGVTTDQAELIIVKPSKKQKKPINIVAVVTPNGIEGSFMLESRRPLIAHLPISSSEINFNEPTEGSSVVEPEPYDPMQQDIFIGDQEEIAQGSVSTQNLKEKEQEKEAATIYEDSKVEGRPLQCFSKINLMVQYSSLSKQKKIPEKTDIACFWCAHGFATQPCVIPEREVAGVYMIYGNFCCPECALSYLLNETVDPHVRWERIALLHRIYDREGKGRMFPAPSRESLKLFGGPLTIESFRATINKGAVRVDTHMPPMVSILGSIDTKPIDFFDSSLKNTLIGSLQQENTVKAQEGLRLRRTKPLKDRESTLDSVMNINIKRS